MVFPRKPVLERNLQGHKNLHNLRCNTCFVLFCFQMQKCGDTSLLFNFALISSFSSKILQNEMDVWHNSFDSVAFTATEFSPIFPVQVSLKQEWSRTCIHQLLSSSEPLSFILMNSSTLLVLNYFSRSSPIKGNRSWLAHVEVGSC